ncbi:MAG: amino acid ABC transporter substrate-binding protein [Nocardioides sp.]
MRALLLPALLTVGALALSSCGDPAAPSSGSSDGPIVIGTTLSLTGPLGSLGSLQKQGYEQAVAWVNDDGGLDVDGTKRKVELVVQDNQSDPNLASQQARAMVLKEGAVALLGPCTPPITIPVAQAAEVQKVPMIATCTPVGAFAAGSETGWNSVFDMFFSEQDQATSAFEAFDGVDSNKKVAIFTDTEPDGIIERDLYKKAAEDAGYEVVGDYTFPVGTTDFAQFINDAKSNDADLVVAQTIPPDGIALWKQMKALGLKPAAAFSAKAAVSGAWWDALKDTAEGTLTEGFWSPDADNASTDEIMDTLGKGITNTPDLGIPVTSLAAAQVLLDAISAAGSTTPADITDAIAATDGDYPVGKVTFSDDHTFVTPHYVLQWSKGDATQVVPEAGQDVAAPTAGLE